MPKFKVSDTVTYARSWIVDAVDEDEAIAKACNEGPDLRTLEADQIDNTPYEAEVVDESH